MEPRIHVMHLLPSLNVGGMENGVVNVTNRIDRRRFKISICCINELGPMACRISEGAATLLCVGQGPGLAPGLFKALFRILRKHDVDIVHTHNHYTSVYGVPAGRAAGIRIIYGLHGFGRDLRATKPRKRRIDAVLCHLSHHVSCVAKQLEDMVCSDFRIPRGKVTTVINGVDWQRFACPPPGRERLRSELGVRDGDLLIGSVGRLSYEKNYGLLLKTAAALAARFPVKVLLVGDGPEAGRLRSQAASLGLENRVIMPGERADVPGLMSTMDVFVLPSLIEGLPNTVLEAMCAGLPIVATSVGGTPDVVAHGMSGFLVPSNDGAALGVALESLFQDEELRRTMGSCGRSLAQTRFSMERMVSEYEALYESVFGRTRQPRR